MFLRNWNVSLNVQLVSWILYYATCLIVLTCLSPFLIRVSMHYVNNQIPEINRENAVHTQTCIPRNNFRLCWTVWDIYLFLTHPAYWNKCVTSEYAQCSTGCRFWVLNISCKVGVLKQSQSASLCSVCHMTKLFVFTRELNVRDRTRWTFVACSSPFRDRTCKFVDWP